MFLAPRGGDRRGPAPELLSRLLDDGYQVQCLVTTRAALPEHPNLRCLYLNVPGRKHNSFIGLLYLSLAGPFAFLGAVLRARPSFILTFHTHAALLAKLGALITWTPVVLFLDVMPWRAAKRRRRFGLWRALLYARDCLGCFCANKIICSSATAANELVTVMPVLESRARLLAYGVRYPFAATHGVPDPAQEAVWLEGSVRRKQQLLRSQQAHEKTFVVATIDEFQSLRNLEQVLRALAALEEDRLLVLVYGEGPQKMSVLSLLISLGMADQVHLLGRSDDFFQLLGSVDLIVVPAGSRGSATLRDLLGSGAAVIAADHPATREVLQHNELLFEPDNVQALVEVLKSVKSSREHLRRLRELTRDRARHFTYDWAQKALDLAAER